MAAADAYCALCGERRVVVLTAVPRGLAGTAGTIAKPMCAECREKLASGKLEREVRK